MLRQRRIVRSRLPASNSARRSSSCGWDPLPAVDHEPAGEPDIAAMGQQLCRALGAARRLAIVAASHLILLPVRQRGFASRSPDSANPDFVPGSPPLSVVDKLRLKAGLGVRSWIFPDFPLTRETDLQEAVARTLISTLKPAATGQNTLRRWRARASGLLHRVSPRSDRLPRLTTPPE
jgi:hypothetical protein